MKVLLLFFLLVAGTACAQQDSAALKKDSVSLPRWLYEAPSYLNLQHYIDSAVTVSQPGLNYRPVVQYRFSLLVDKEGKIREAQLLSAAGNQDLAEQVRHILLTMPEWRAARLEGKAISCVYELSFTLNHRQQQQGPGWR